LCFTFSYSLFSISLRGKEYEGGLLSYSQVLFQRVGSSSEATRRESSVHVCITVTAVKSAFFSLCVQSHNHVSKVYLLFTDIFFALGQRRGLVGLLSCLLASSRFSTLHSHVRVTSCVRGKVDSFILCVCVLLTVLHLGWTKGSSCLTHVRVSGRVSRSAWQSSITLLIRILS